MHARARPMPAIAGDDSKAVYDAALVLRFKQGDESAFGEIVERHYAFIRGLANRVLHNLADAEEVAQDTFIRAHRGLASFRGESSLAGWLRRIGLNLARNRYAFFSRRQRHATVSLDLPAAGTGDRALADALSGDTADPRAESISSEFTVLVADCMARLDAPFREILEMRTKQHLSYDEIAARLKVTEGVVRSRIARAREKLRDLLRERPA